MVSQPIILLLLSILGAFRVFVSLAYTVPPPPVSPATKLPNNIYEWRGQQVRWQMAGDPDAEKAVVLVHGLFVNSDHWRYTLKGLADAGYRAYAIDLLGSGYSSKPSPWDMDVSNVVNGERGRFFEDLRIFEGVKARTKVPSILKDTKLGTASGGERVGDVDLRHPLGSPYNFYTWGEQIADFTQDVVLRNKGETATLVCNSIGTMSSLQAVLDEPDFYDGVFVICPNFRELHSAEIPLAKVSMPILRSVQKLLRSKGQGLFDKLAKPDIVKQILMEPYAVSDAVDEELVDVLLSPLLTPGASDVVFDTLSYSAGPLPEQQLGDPNFPVDKVPVWITYGDQDPWTPGKRVEKLGALPSVEKVVAFKDVGHCPHDEAPEIVNPLLLQFLDRTKARGD
mmetsp:Transcript_20801/g.45372  ORF Transcript_20801/g.45372 Transcript_20801/m.45372 type:complete len:396 (-) Transcript_20801:559-1746(-)